MFDHAKPSFPNGLLYCDVYKVDNSSLISMQSALLGMLAVLVILSFSILFCFIGLH